MDFIAAGVIVADQRWIDLMQPKSSCTPSCLTWSPISPTDAMLKGSLEQ